MFHKLLVDYFILGTKMPPSKLNCPQLGKLTNIQAKQSKMINLLQLTKTSLTTAETVNWFFPRVEKTWETCLD